MTKSVHTTKPRSVARPAGQADSVQAQLCWLMARDADPDGVVSLVARMLCMMNRRERGQFVRNLQWVFNLEPALLAHLVKRQTPI